jgi:Xaa-Pro aminopeptidase
MWQAGAEAIRFLVVQFGSHSARPHFYPTDRPLQVGDWVLMDWVPIYKGYASDVTRTVVVGRADARQREVYRLVQAAQQAGLAGVRAGATGDEVDARARRIITDGGYGDAFGHSLGHGINEGPSLDVGSSDVLQPGMVVTVEPGIYLPGWGGVRIEDTVVVREEGVEVLPHTSKDLVVI